MTFCDGMTIVAKNCELVTSGGNKLQGGVPEGLASGQQATCAEAVSEALEPTISQAATIESYRTIGVQDGTERWKKSQRPASRSLRGGKGRPLHRAPFWTSDAAENPSAICAY